MGEGGTRKPTRPYGVCMEPVMLALHILTYWKKGKSVVYRKMSAAL